MKKPLEDLFRRELVGRIRTRAPVTAFPQTTLAEAVRLLQTSTGCVVAIEKWEGRLRPVGIFTERDYLMKVATQAGADASTSDFERLPLERFMTRGPRTLSLEDDLDTAICLMTEGGYRHLPLVDRDGSLAGVLSVRDIIVHLAEMFPVECLNRSLKKEEASLARDGG